MQKREGCGQDTTTCHIQIEAANEQIADRLLLFTFIAHNLMCLVVAIPVTVVVVVVATAAVMVTSLLLLFHFNKTNLTTAVI